MMYLLALLLQLQPIITAHNPWMSKISSILNYEHLPFCVTDLVLIYESVTSLASVIRWLALHSWTFNFHTAAELRLSWNELTSRRTECKSPRLKFLSNSVCIRYHGNVLPNRCPALDYSATNSYSGNMLPELLPTNGHIRHNIISHQFRGEFIRQGKMFIIMQWAMVT
jgi:hypothetical protein